MYQLQGSDNVRQGRTERKGTNEIRSVRECERSGPLGYNLCRNGPSESPEACGIDCPGINPVKKK